jgi:uncharacterized protein (DUF1015 family)
MPAMESRATRSGSAVPDPDGLVLAPFRALRYNPAAVRDLASVTSPPYDLIDEEQAGSLEQAEPHNVVRLILPRDGAVGDDRYAHARDTLAQWRTQGVLVQDDKSALYVYEQAEGDRVLQRGLLGGVGLVDPKQGIVLPHEDVLEGPIRDRLALMESLDANPEPIFLLYDGGGPASEIVDEAAAEDPLAVADGGDGVTHKLWRITDPARLTLIEKDLAPRHALIADGHHRYATYRRLQAHRHTAGLGPGPWDFGLALLVDQLVYPPRLQAIHRVVRDLDWHDALERARLAFESCLLLSDNLEPALEALADAGAEGPAFLLSGGHDFYLLTGPKTSARVPGHSDAWGRLDASIAHGFVLESVWQVDDVDTLVSVRHRAEDAVALARATRGTALLLNPTPLDAVFTLARNGEHMPRKSTSFGPKPLTGMVIRPLAE